MRRWHQELAITKRQWLLHRQIHVDINKGRVKEVGKDPYEVDCACDDQKGRFRKTDAYDCGHSRCYLCHNHKVPKRLISDKEKISDLDFKEQLAEL